MKLEFLNKEEKEKILEKLKIYGIKEIPFLLFKSSSDRIRAYSGSLSREEIEKLNNRIFIETIGLYFARLDGGEIRLSIDALHLLKEQIRERIIELTREQAEEYLKGREIELDEEQKKLFGDKQGYFVLKNNFDILGMAKIVQGRIKNYLPKERRRK